MKSIDEEIIVLQKRLIEVLHNKIILQYDIKNILDFATKEEKETQLLEVDNLICILEEMRGLANNLKSLSSSAISSLKVINNSNMVEIHISDVNHMLRQKVDGDADKWKMCYNYGDDFVEIEGQKYKYRLLNTINSKEIFPHIENGQRVCFCVGSVIGKDLTFIVNPEGKVYKIVRP